MGGLNGEFAERERTAKRKTDARYYIPEDRRATALKRYKPLHGGIASLIGILIACVALCFILLYYTPDVVRLADNAIGLIK